MARGLVELVVGGHPEALSIAGLYDELDAALAAAFPRRRELWVRGEIQHVSDQRSGRGHCYIDLVDPESAGERQAPVLRVKCWQSTWSPLRSSLAREGIELAPGMVVVLRGTIDFYRAKAELGFILQELDVTALIGRLAAQRASLLRALDAEGLLRRNRSLPVPAVPLRIGLVASPGTEGYRDFLGQLTGSGLGFHVLCARATVQGAEATASVSRAVGRLSSLGPEALDLIVIVRGGGSKGDLAVFDAERIARAVATSRVPVWTGIGHTGDESVTDIVANRACITPTDCAKELVQRVGEWWESNVAVPASVLRRRAQEVAAAASREREATRTRVCAMARHLVDRQAEDLRRRGVTTARYASRVVDDAWGAVRAKGMRLPPLAAGHVARSADRVVAWRRLVAAYDVERQLERGYTLTLDARGRVVRDAGTLRAGDTIVTRFARGSARSSVTGTDDERDGRPRAGERVEA